jgi:hypothetical protein
LLGTEDVSLQALGAGVFDLVALAGMLMQILGGAGGGGGMGGGGGGMRGGVQMLEGGLNSSSNSSGSSCTNSSLREGTPTRPQFYFK